jgi:hypothetical protein
MNGAIVIPNEVRDLANGHESRDFSRVFHHLRRSSPHDLFFDRFNASAVQRFNE